MESGDLYPVCQDLSRVAILLKEFGVCVIPDVFSSAECDSWMLDMVTSMEKLAGGKINHKKPNDWKGNHLPFAPQYGLYQHLLNNLKPVWQIRRDTRMKEIFKSIYSELRGKVIDEFVCSIDGVNVQPNVAHDTTKEKDWPHCDQTERDNIYKCVQGQVVLTNTQACFRASPSTHRYFVDVMEMCHFPDNDYNWAQFNERDVELIKERILTPNQLPFQIPVRVCKGSVIVWLSTTIHSAMKSNVKEKATKEDPFKGWRGVVYVCYRPLAEFTAAQLNVLEQCLRENKGTNHWSTMVFELPQGGGLGMSPVMEKWWHDPPSVYKKLGFRPHLKSCLINEPVVDAGGVDVNCNSDEELANSHCGEWFPRAFACFTGSR